MKTILKFSTIVMTMLLTTFTVAGQKTVNLITDGAAIAAEIDEQTKSDILKVVQSTLNTYYNTANFWDENAEAFDDDKYTEFIGLFTGSARVYEDIAESPSNIEYSIYANNVYQYLQEEGVQFLLENVYLNSVDIDETGFYVARLDMDKIVYVGLDENNFAVKLGDGKRYTLNVKIDMPDYDVSAAKIQAITGEETAKRIKTTGYLSANFHYGLGSFREAAANIVGQNFGGLTNKSAGTVGAMLLYRKSLNQSDKFWFHMGAGVQRHTLNSSFQNFDNSSLPGEETSRSPFRGAFINGATPTAYETENNSPLVGNVTISKIDESIEVLRVITVDVPIGISIRLNKTYKSRVFLDLSVVPSYSISSFGSTQGKPEGVIIPDSEHFPSVATIQAQPDGAERLQNYTFDDEDFQFEDTDLSVGNNFGLGVQLSPTYKYDIDFKYGIEIGFNFWYNVMSLLGSNDSIEGYLKNEFANNSFGTKTSILEDYFGGVYPFYASLKVGFFYKIN